MALSVFEFSVPPQTKENSPVIQTFEISSPHLSHVKVYIPPGHQGLARIRVRDRENNIIPSEASIPQWLRGDGVSFEDDMDRMLSGPPWAIQCLGWNADDVITHTFFVYLSHSNK